MSAIQAKTDSIRVVGITLAVIGVCLAVTTYFLINSISLTGIGIAVLVLGLAGIAAASGSPEISSDVLKTNTAKNWFFLSLAIFLAAVNALLIFLNENDLAIYFIVDTIIYFVMALAFVRLSFRSKVALNKVGGLLFVAFLAVVVLKVVQLAK
jgi:hypothetical protein